MFDGLIGNLNADKWREAEMSEKNEAEFTKYHVMRNHKRIADTTLHYMVAVDDGDPKNVELYDCAVKKDPLKEIGVIELKLNAEETEVIGIDLNGDIVVRK